MEFFRIKGDLPFMKYALYFNAISLITFLIAVGALFTKGLHYGIDFTGGTVAELRYAKPADMAQARAAIEGLKTGEAVVQNFGTPQDVLVRLPLVQGITNAQMSENLFKAVCGARPVSDTKTACGDGAEKIELKRVEFVGPQVGKELFESGALALVLVIAGIMMYLAIRFEWRFAVSAIIANLHDIIIILGLFAIFGWEFNLPVLAGVLAILGYSVNESVVIADRVRENFRKMRKASVDHVIDNAITSTISRTIITHGSTQIMVLAMLFFGGETLHYFALALTIGICFGIYSSVLVMAPLVRWLGTSRENLVKPEAKPKDALEAEKILP
ncbi:MAG TPA: protein translocase subunit SecF [Casimicrobium huifangae]|uniref:protein translocase subunit SecF n=1 Tax=Casimicrobium huifangae TaxID=2591109 RepID=UPI0012EB8DD7|nr:protein translocase subunit SecF [Casimicrobium huifangae]HQD66401.1 protein translocase subunit SecF [Casimicrobium huifangae]